MKTKSWFDKLTIKRKIPGIMFTSFLVLLFFVWLGPFLNFECGLEDLIPRLEFTREEAIASVNELLKPTVVYVESDTFYVVSDSASPGDSMFWINIGLINTYRTAGFEFKLCYDTSLLAPVYKVDTVTTQACDTCPPTLDTNFAIDADKTTRTAPLTWNMFAGGIWNNHFDTTSFIAAILPTPPQKPILAKGRDPIVKIKFRVKDSATPGDTTSISFVGGIAGGTNIPNVYYDSTFGTTYVPRHFISGTFTVKGGGTPGNHCPSFKSMSLERQVNEGDTLRFDVTATDDVDQDTITLSMNPLDTAYHYSFSTIKGKSSVTQTFSFSPTFFQGPDTIYAVFKAQDEHGCLITTTVSIKIIDVAQDLIIVSGNQGGVPGSSGRMVPLILTNTISIYGFQFTLRWDHTKVDIDSFVRTPAILNSHFTMYTNLDSLAHRLGEVTVLVFGLASQTIPAGIETVLYAAFSVDANAPPGEVPLQLENAREATDPGDPSKFLVMLNGKFTIDRFGDANLDKLVDIADVVGVVAYILNKISFTTRQFMAADVVPNDTVNVADLVGIINIILERWSGPSPSPYFGPMATVRLDYEDLKPGTAGEVNVLANLQVPVAGAQIKIGYDPKQLSFEVPRLSEWSDKFIAEYKDDKQGKLTVLLYNLSNDPISRGEGKLFSLPVTVSPDAINNIKLGIDQIVLADQKAVEIPVDDGKASVPKAFDLSQNYPNPFNPTTTIKYALPSAGDGEGTLPTTLKIYNILGEVVRTLVNEPKSPGVYYEVWDGKDNQGNQVAAGVYFYQLRAAKFSETKKMVLLK
jgi:hypothetical protein